MEDGRYPHHEIDEQKWKYDKVFVCTSLFSVPAVALLVMMCLQGPPSICSGDDVIPRFHLFP
jgi:hypothetical protein